MRWTWGAIWWGGCAESPTGRFQLTWGENNCSKITNETLHQIHPQSITRQSRWQSPPRPGGKGWVQQKKSLLRCGITRTRGFSPGLIAGVNISLVISNVWLKRASGDFPLAGERASGPVHRHPFCSSPEVSIPSPSKPNWVFSDVFVVVLLKGASAGTCECEYANVLKKAGISREVSQQLHCSHRWRLYCVLWSLRGI